MVGITSSSGGNTKKLEDAINKLNSTVNNLNIRLDALIRAIDELRKKT